MCMIFFVLFIDDYFVDKYITLLSNSILFCDHHFERLLKATLVIMYSHLVSLFMLNKIQTALPL